MEPDNRKIGAIMASRASAVSVASAVIVVKAVRVVGKGV
jgi:hypothetical protein